MYEIINPADAKIEDLKDTGVKFEVLILDYYYFHDFIEKII